MSPEKKAEKLERESRELLLELSRVRREQAALERKAEEVARLCNVIESCVDAIEEVLR